MIGKLLKSKKDASPTCSWSLAGTVVPNSHRDAGLGHLITHTLPVVMTLLQILTFTNNAAAAELNTTTSSATFTTSTYQVASSGHLPDFPDLWFGQRPSTYTTTPTPHQLLRRQAQLRLQNTFLAPATNPRCVPLLSMHHPISSLVHLTHYPSISGPSDHLPSCPCVLYARTSCDTNDSVPTQYDITQFITEQNRSGVHMNIASKQYFKKRRCVNIAASQQYSKCKQSKLLRK